MSDGVLTHDHKMAHPQEGWGGWGLNHWRDHSEKQGGPPFYGRALVEFQGTWEV